jgi:hypothetical protein
MMSSLAVITFNAIPAVRHSYKYDVLGEMAVADHRRYCARHGYRFVSDVTISPDRPACWAKIPAILDGLQSHEWVLWLDSDVLVADPTRAVVPFCDPAYDLIVQDQAAYWRLLGVPPADGQRRMPLNSGVFLIRATAWAKDFLRRAYDRSEFVTRGAVWDGIGEQEAMIALLHEAPEDMQRIKLVDGLQAPPRFFRSGTLFLHFYGNHARHHIPPDQSAAVLQRWRRAVEQGAALPADQARFHWCCIQNKSADLPIKGGDLGAYLYRPEDLAPR